MKILNKEYFTDLNTHSINIRLSTISTIHIYCNIGNGKHCLLYSRLSGKGASYSYVLRSDYDSYIIKILNDQRQYCKEMISKNTWLLNKCLESHLPWTY